MQPNRPKGLVTLQREVDALVRLQTGNGKYMDAFIVRDADGHAMLVTN